MGRFKSNRAFKRFRGQVDGFVYTRRKGETFVSAVPEPTDNPPTEAQLRSRARFLKAAAYGTAVNLDPVRREPYRLKAEGTLASVYALAVGDYMHSPRITELDLVAYNGHVGDLITIDAEDDFEVVSVRVQMKNPAGDVIEEGPATLVEGYWLYHGKTDVPRDQNILIEAQAEDRAHNQTSLSDTWHA